MGGSKKLKDFFLDAKVPREDRRLVPVLCSGERIVWVVGHRLDDRVKITPRTSRVLVVRYRRAGP
jgi:tRNA(Ile)-lysidine synthase